MTKPNTRSRYLINHNSKFIIFVNFKCGFTAINNVAAQDSNMDTSVKNPDMFREWLLDNDVSKFCCYFVSRDPVSRLMSYYFDWIVDKGEEFFSKKEGSNIKNLHFEKLKKVMSLDDYEMICGATSEQKSSPEIFALFISYLPDFFNLDPHTIPQHRLFSTAGMAYSVLDRVIDTSDITHELSHLFSTDIPHLNKGSYTVSNRRLLKSSAELSIVESLYAKDYEYFNYRSGHH